MTLPYTDQEASNSIKAGLKDLECREALLASWQTQSMPIGKPVRSTDVHISMIRNFQHRGQPANNRIALSLSTITASFSTIKIIKMGARRKRAH